MYELELIRRLEKVADEALGLAKFFAARMEEYKQERNELLRAAEAAVEAFDEHKAVCPLLKG